jgi:TRAP-type C4-dicarboxylate transport system substrate-binding protein
MEVPLMTFQTGRFYEVQKYVSLTRQMWDGQWSLVNGALWKSMPDDIRAIISKNLDQSALQQRADVATLELQLVTDFPKRGIEVFTVDQAPFRKRLETVGFYKEWKERYNPDSWALLEKFTTSGAG